MVDSPLIIKSKEFTLKIIKGDIYDWTRKNGKSNASWCELWQRVRKSKVRVQSVMSRV